MSDNPTLRFRFTFNRRTGGRPEIQKNIRATGLSFAHTIVEDVGEVAASETYNELKGRMRQQIQRVVHREIEHIAKLYYRFIIGIERARFQGSLSTLANTGEFDTEGNPVRSRIPLGSMLEPWAARSRKYLRRKQREYGHKRWFERSKALGDEMKNDASWYSFFGPLRIRLVREKDKVLRRDGSGHFAVGRIEVRAFGNLTPSMLPALSTGNPRDIEAGDGRSNGLINLVHRKNPKIGHHLAGGRSRNVPYRPTVEPFLSFVLTRSVPTAVFSQLRRATDGVGSAGRTRRRT